ncbi:MAG TPA: hypothetical protein DEA32_00685 [Firmicutes bacterium]|nr:hypothetical protein [Bacillota bacterium]
MKKSIKKNGIEMKIRRELNVFPYSIFCLNDIRTRCSYSAKTKVVTTLEEEGTIDRVINGIYRIKNHEKPITIMDLAFAIARKNSWFTCPLPTDDSKKLVVKSSGPSRQYDYQGMHIEFQKENSKLLPSSYYSINLIIHNASLLPDPTQPNARFLKSSRNLLSAEEYAKGMKNLKKKSLPWVRPLLRQVFAEQPEHFKNVQPVRNNGIKRRLGRRPLIDDVTDNLVVKPRAKAKASSKAKK